MFLIKATEKEIETVKKNLKEALSRDDLIRHIINQARQDIIEIELVDASAQNQLLSYIGKLIDSKPPHLISVYFSNESAWKHD